jgi:hypothetical protein
MIPISFRLLVIVFCSVLLLASVRAAKWPEDYVVEENSESPNGRYALLIQTQDAAEEQENSEHSVYLANVKAHQVLGKIKGVDYFEHENHAGLGVTWAKDSSWCVVESDGRFGFATIDIIELTERSFIDTDIGEKIGKDLAGVIKKESHNSEEEGGYGVTYFRLGADRKFRVRVAATTDPKQLNGQGAYYALFQGIFDVREKKWLATDTRPLKKDEFDATDIAFGNLDVELEHTSFESQDKTQWLDARMNEVYNMVRTILPPDRFAKIKQEQVEWLKKRDAASSPEQKNKLMDARIRALQALLW